MCNVDHLRKAFETPKLAMNAAVVDILESTMEDNVVQEACLHCNQSLREHIAIELAELRRKVQARLDKLRSPTKNEDPKS